MIPIYEQADGRGVGHGIDSFLRRFDQICEDHLNTGRARAFAFIFYNFQDQELRQILRDHGVFAQLDRLSGSHLSLFYLHTGRKHVVDVFNEKFLSTLGIEETAIPPCVVFFRYENNNIVDIAVTQLENANLIHGFHELYGVIEQYINAEPASENPRYLKWLKDGGQFVSIEAFRAALRFFFGLLM